MNITFLTLLHRKTYEHYFNQPMQMVERILNTKLYKNPELVEKIKDAHLTLHMGRKQITLDERWNINIRILVQVSIILLTIFE